MSVAEQVREDATKQGLALLIELGILDRIKKHANALGWGYKIREDDYEVGLAVIKAALELNGFSVYDHDDRSMRPYKKYIEVYW